MKCLAILVVCVVGAAVAVPEGYGHYVPKAYYYLDPYGQPSAPQQIHPDTLNRVRRQVQPFQPFGFPNFAPIQIPQGAQGSSNFVSSSLNSRFGEEPVVTGQSSFTTTNNKGQTQQSTTYLRPDGTTYTQTNTRPKRQTQQQGQSQNGGNQQQSQSQNGGNQNQFQSQNGGGEQTQFQAQNGQNQQGANVDNINQPTQVSNVEQGINENLPQPQFANNNNQAGGQPQQQFVNNQGGGQPQQQQQPNPQVGGQPQIPQFGYNAFPFAQQGFGFPQQQGFAPFPQFPFPMGGFAQPGFGPAGFGAPFPGGNPIVASPIQPGQPGTNFQDGNLNTRFSDDSGSFSGGSTVVSSNNNGVFHTTSQTIGPDGKVHTTSSKGVQNGPTSFSTRISDDGHSGAGTFTSGGSTVTTNNNGVYHSTSQTIGPDGKVRTFSSRFNDEAGSNAGQNANIPISNFNYGYAGFPQTFNQGYAGGFISNQHGLSGGGLSTRSFTDDDGNVVTETKRYGPDGKVIETRKS